MCLIFVFQEVHELLSNYDLKYCFVDKYKGTGWYVAECTVCEDQ